MMANFFVEEKTSSAYAYLGFSILNVLIYLILRYNTLNYRVYNLTIFVDQLLMAIHAY